MNRSKPLPRFVSPTVCCGAYQLTETLRAVFAGDLETPIVLELFGSLVFRAERSRIPEFVKCIRTIRAHRDGIIAAVDLELSNGRHE